MSRLRRALGLIITVGAMVASACLLADALQTLILTLPLFIPDNYPLLLVSRYYGCIRFRGVGGHGQGWDRLFSLEVAEDSPRDVVGWKRVWRL